MHGLGADGGTEDGDREFSQMLFPSTTLPNTRQTKTARRIRRSVGPILFHIRGSGRHCAYGLGGGTSLSIIASASASAAGSGAASSLPQPIRLRGIATPTRVNRNIRHTDCIWSPF